MRFLRPLALAASVVSSLISAHAKEAFPPTEPGVFEIKTLPAGMLLRSDASEGTYFDNSGTLFRPLFRYIDRRDIAMTTPVEARVEPGQMFFWVAEEERSKVDGNAAGVTVLELPERVVASRGARGGYSVSNYEKVRKQLEEWVAAHPDWEAAGDAYPVYWHGPMTPAFVKRFEVHIPVRERERKT